MSTLTTHESAAPRTRGDGPEVPALMDTYGLLNKRLPKTRYVEVTARGELRIVTGTGATVSGS